MDRRSRRAAYAPPEGPGSRSRRSNGTLDDAGVLFSRLQAKARARGPIRTAVVHPVDRESLTGTLQAVRAGLIVPVLVGPKDRILSVARANELDIAGISLIATEHSHEAADIAVRLAQQGEVDALMKGSLHTDELMSAAVASTGLRTDRRMSHVFVHQVPRYPRPLLITDAALNIEPDLAAKRDIVQNAVELALAVGIQAPRVAVLSAVETVNPNIRSSVDAAALAKMGDRGQITDGVIDGPLAFDDAVSVAAAHAKGIVSPVAGRADVLVVPDLESGNMLTKQLDYLAGSQAAGLVIGGRVPIALTSRADGASEHVASCALAVLFARRHEIGRPLASATADDRAQSSVE